MRDSVTFIHAADLHLDAPFQGIAADDERVGRELAEATYTAWRRIVDLAIARGVDFVVLAGDAYNSAHRTLRAQLAFAAEATRLSQAGIPLLLVNGNHDPASGFSARKRLPESVHTFPTGSVGRFEIIAEDGFVCAVYGQSFARVAETDNLALGYKRDAADTVAVGLLHTNVGGNVDYEPYAPCVLADLAAAQMDYWALGHIHKHEVVSKQPWAVYAGSPQGLNPKETGEHGCDVVSITATGMVAHEHVDLAPIAWAQVTLDVSAATTVDDIQQAVSEACGGLRLGYGRPVVARFTMEGRSSVHGDLARPGAMDALRDAVRAEAVAGSPWVWIDRLRSNMSAPMDMDALREGETFASEALRDIDALEADQSMLEELFGDLSRPLEAKMHGVSVDLDPKAVLARAREIALDGLLAKGGRS